MRDFFNSNVDNETIIPTDEILDEICEPAEIDDTYDELSKPLKGIRDEFELARMMSEGTCFPEEAIAISALRIANSLEQIEKSLERIAKDFNHSYDDGK